MPRSFPLLSLALTGSLICGSLVIPAPAHAGQHSGAPEAEAPEGEAEPPAEEPEDPALVEARDLYKQGEISFQTGEFTAALSLWKQAFAILPDGDDTRAIRHALVYNIAEAHTRAYEVSRNPTHLRTAKVMLETYRKDHLVLYGEEPEAVSERAEVDDRIAELDQKIEASVAAGEEPTPLEQTAAATTTTTADEEPEPEPEPEPAPKPPKPPTPRQQWEKELKADPVLGPQWSKANKRVIGGAVLSGIGVPFAFISLGLFALAASASGNDDDPTDPDPMEDPDNPDPTPGSGAGVGFLWGSGVATGIIALGLLIPGGILLGKGVAGRKQVLEAKPRPVSRLTPSLGPRGAGLSYTLRF